MLLLLIRHAQAAQQDEARYPDDTLRPLVPKGRKIQRRTSRELRKRKLAPSRVFGSPWKRAWQTARIVVQETGLPKTARIAWAIMVHGGVYEAGHRAAHYRAEACAAAG